MEEWDQYLVDLVRRGIITAELAGHCRGVLLELNLTLKTPIPAPVTVPTEDYILISWDKGRYHFDIVILPDGSFEWFFRDRFDESYEGSDESETELSMKAYEKLELTLSFFDKEQ